jgi:hypothetical protein
VQRHRVRGDAGVDYAAAAPVQTVPLARWAGENFTVGPVRCQAFAIGEELIPRNITRTMVMNNNAPLILWQLAGLRTDLAGRVELLTRLVAAKHVGAGVRWISKNADHPRVSQPCPDELAIPSSAICSTREEKAELVKALHHPVGAALFLEQFDALPGRGRERCCHHRKPIR